MNPISVIERQVLAYNSRDIEAFALCHHPQVKLYNFPDTKPFAVGRDQLIAIYSEVFDQSPRLHTEIVHRMVLGHTVIDNEIVTGRSGTDTLKIIAIYTLEDNQIASAHFIREN